MTDDTSSADTATGFSSLDTMQQRLAAMADGQQRYNSELAISTQLGRQFGRTLTAAFIGLTVQGKSFGDVLGSLALSLSRLALGAAFKPLEGVFGTALQSLLSAPSAFSGASIAAPSGFPISAGSSVSADASRPASSYAAASRSAPSPGAGTSIVLNVTTPDAESFRRSETQLAAVLARAVGQGQRNL